MKNKLKLIIMVILSMAILTGCSGKSPSDVVESYFSEIKTGENADVTNYISDTIKENTDKKEEKAKEDPKMNEAMKIFMSNIDAKVLSEKIDGDNATVEVELKGFNLSNIVVEILQENLSNMFSGKELKEDEVSQSILEKVKTAKVETRKGTINLSKVDKKWKIKTDDKAISLIFGKTEELNKKDI
ncbi:DUF4878 domain-containing protein [Romboutsia sedimentorum]|uniref:DUF4878 domain-containing protein n=1 Tax=Romboutsia sedimentorum TaxID=1368474 RepID=A0ABT7E5N2_9FIRM|nr:DUF4878 domain-containing protein [Romboutsia sedimentorum]MDK2562235.1 DUF4878 domain-containing protein [Romboutsia sedimentorum]